MSADSQPKRPAGVHLGEESRHGWVRAALLTAGPLVLFGPMILRGEALYWGTPMLQFIPWRELALRLVSSGQLPLWDPFLGMGAPLLANYQSALLYPPNWLLALAGPAWGQGVLVALHLIWAGWGMARLAKKLGLGELAQVVAGLSFSLSGYMVARAGFLTINAAAAWLPWLILGAERLIESTRRGVSWSSVVVPTTMLSLGFAFQWLAGHAQTAWYSLMLVLAWVIWRALENREDRSLLYALAGLIAAGITAFALSAVQLLPTLEYLIHSQRSTAVGRELAMTYSFWPWRLIGLLAPNLFGNPASADYWGYGNFWEDAIYIGVLPFIMAVAAVIRGIRRGRHRSSLVRLLVVTGAVAFILALGNNTPVFPFLFDHVPTFDLFQAPTRWDLILVFNLALLAAIGVDGWGRPTGRGLYWSRLGTVGGGVVMLFAPVGVVLLPGVEPTFVRGLVWAGGLLCLTGILTLIHPAERSTWWHVAGGAFVLLDLCLAGAGLNPAIDASVFRSQGDLTGGAAGHRSYMTSEAEYKLKFEDAFPFSSFQSDIAMSALLDLGIPNTLVLQGRSSANNFDPILPERYSDFVERLDSVEQAQQEAIFQLMDVSTVVSLGRDGRFQAAEVEDPQRARVVPNAVWSLSEQETLDRVMAPDFNPDEVVVLEGVGVSRSADVRGEAVILQGINPNRVEVRVSSDGDGWLVLSDLWYPGWRAFVDDRPADMLRADDLFRAVDIPKGEHIVRFEYSPTSFWIGLGLSAAAWLILLSVLWRSRRG